MLSVRLVTSYVINLTIIRQVTGEQSVSTRKAPTSKRKSGDFTSEIGYNRDVACKMNTKWNESM